ncbi:MAG: methyl-accepting chemotaxis protein [Pseudomonadota bacterium]
MYIEDERDTAIKQLRRGRGLAVNAGAIGITLATATDPAERTEMAAYLTDFTARFTEVITAIKDMPLVREAAKSDPAKDAALEEIEGFAREIASVDPAETYGALSRDAASLLTTRARTATLPAFYLFIRAFEAAREEAGRERARHLEAQTAQLEKMFAEVEDIGRMIHLISLNASVEAARAGGESGRSFKVIADEIRSLAAKSAGLIDTTRAALSDPAGAVRVGAVRAGGHGAGSIGAGGLGAGRYGAGLAGAGAGADNRTGNNGARQG